MLIEDRNTSRTRYMYVYICEYIYLERERGEKEREREKPLFMLSIFVGTQSDFKNAPALSPSSFYHLAGRAHGGRHM
jgi:hypothetical protein